ncbi:MAG: DUF4831 family protein [Bacteroidales bacterium]|nr:DUF4831 family protein [Bacteroidales bacterium]
MKKIAKILVAASVAAAPFVTADAQQLFKGSEVPSGVVIYSLPSTSLTFCVEAVREDFKAGPYAQYAQKYMGSEARTSDEVTYSLKSIDLVPYLEADPSVRMAINLKGKATASANFLQFCSQGLIVASDSYTGKAEAWRFPSIANNDQFAGKDVDGNLTDANTTLYRTVKTSTGGYEKVSVSQKQVVEKSAEKKAAETAATIFELRRQRLAIVTGDTDATYSGEAMGAAIGEINRLESEYMSLFYGKSIESVERMNFDVVPSADKKDQMYVAFRLSDSDGLLPASDVMGRPIVLQLELDNLVQNTVKEASKGGETIFYRVPRTATARVLDGEKMLLQTRIPIYQLGQTMSFPLGTAIQ